MSGVGNTSVAVLPAGKQQQAINNLQLADFCREKVIFSE
jgi:hypothetical protein